MVEGSRFAWKACMAPRSSPSSGLRRVRLAGGGSSRWVVDDVCCCGAAGASTRGGGGSLCGGCWVLGRLSSHVMFRSTLAKYSGRLAATSFQSTSEGVLASSGIRPLRPMWWKPAEHSRAKPSSV